MEKSLVDVPVLILFFNRPDTLKAVFSAVRAARPSVLLLAQDGPRAGRGDEEKIEECRKIVEEIDWECTVYKDYSPINLSCDHREFTAITWAFQKVDRLIVLEDDCVPCASFFPFCAELLERYKDDKRVDRICGFNRLEKYEDITNDYLFSTIASGYGWATWKRCWDEIEQSKDYAFLSDENLVKVYNKSRKVAVDKGYGDILKECEICRIRNEKMGKISSWENLVGVYTLLNHSLVITPRYNMVKNIGAVEGSTHYSSLKYVNSSVKRLLMMDSYEMNFPLRHPTTIFRDINYEKKHYKKIHKNCIQKLFLKIEVFFKRLLGGDIKGIAKALKRMGKKNG